MTAGQVQLFRTLDASKNLDCIAILARLERGPARNHELADICLGYRQRIDDLRKAGHVIQCLNHVFHLRSGQQPPVGAEPMFGAPSGSMDEALPVYDGAVPAETPRRMPTAPCSVQGCEFHGLPCAECGDGPFCVPCLAGHYCGAPDAGRLL